MTVLRPGMRTTYRLPDGSIYAVTIGTEGQPEDDRLKESHSVDSDRPSGRELDAAIAHHVFGLEVEPRVNARTRERDAVSRLPNGDWVRVAFYSASMGASLNVQLALSDRGWTWVGARDRSTGDVRVVLEHTDGRTVEATGLINEALCRAALKAVSP